MLMFEIGLDVQEKNNEPGIPFCLNHAHIYCQTAILSQNENNLKMISDKISSKYIDRIHQIDLLIILPLF